MIIVATDPWNTGKALTWLSGSTYGRTAGQIVPVLVALALTVPLLAYARRDLDLLALDEDTPRVLGVRLERTRMIALVAAALLTSTAVSAVGVVGFVGLVAPHAARALVGGRHARVLPVAALLGALMVSARRHPRPDRHRAGPDSRRSGHRADRHPVLRLVAMAVAYRVWRRFMIPAWRFFPVTVGAVRRVSPSFVRVTFTGD